MSEWIELGRQIRKYVNPETFPVAVQFLENPAEIHSGARRPLKDLGVRLAPCQAAAMARRYGWTVAVGREDVGCAIAAHTYGWERLEEPSGAVRFMTRMNYARDEEAARAALVSFRKLEPVQDLMVVYSPLEWTRVKPDVVLVYANPAQLMRLIHAGTHRTGKPIESAFTGRAASCTEGVVAARLDQTLKVVIPGNGDRVWGGCQDHEVAMAIPAGRLAEVAEGLEKTHERGIRYPIPTYLRYSPEVAFSLPLADIFKTEGW